MSAKLDLNIVKDLALDVWEDLKRTGLAGVAVGMAIAFVAISAIVLRPGGPPEIKTGYATAGAAPTQEVALAVPGEEPLKISDVDLSSPRDPFQTLDQLESSSEGGGDPVQTIADTTVASTSDSGGSSSGGSTDSSTTVSYDDSEALVPLDDLETADTTEPSTDTGDEPKGEIVPKDEPTEAPATDYSYVADIQFGPEGSLTRYRSLQRLGLVPSRSLPLLMYLGVATDHKTGVFMVGSSLSQGGEGNCVPKASQCTFLELQTGPAHDEHHFRDAEDQEYILRLRGLVRTTASAGSVGGPDIAALSGTPSVVDGSP